jgi:tetratricopeptide (TPR) repeat protein
MDTGAPDVESPAAAESSGGPRPTIALARARLIDGDIEGARAAFEQLTASQENRSELLLTEATLLEAEGRAEEALASLHHIVTSAAEPAWIVASAHPRLARLAVRLGREDLAESSAMAMLEPNPDDVEGLRALAFARRRDAGSEAHLQAMRRLASAPAAEEADIWDALDAFAAAGRWADVLALIEQHAFDLDPWRMAPPRVTALIALGWHRRAHEQLARAHAHGYIGGRQAVALLIECGALALAARFVDGSMRGDPWQAEARARVVEAVTRLCAAPGEQDASPPYADAVLARAILHPGLKEAQAAVDRTRQTLARSAGALLASGDPAGATRLLVAAARLSPEDRGLLESLAEASRRAGLTERLLDTLLRIWTIHRDASALLAAAHDLLETSSWSTISEVMSVAAAQAKSIGIGIDVVVEKFREQACRKVEYHIRDGDVAAALELLIGLGRQWSIVDWPDTLVSRLLRATKRRLRTPRGGGEAFVATVAPLYLELAPADVDVCRMMARIRMRQRRLVDARTLLGRVVEIDPHVADDWVCLASVHNDLGALAARDVALARALIIAPDETLPPVLSIARAQMLLA